MKKKKPQQRNPHAIPSKKRKAGSHKPKQDKRKSGQKKQDRYLDEDY
jgi:hypothetical protein